MSNFFQKIKSLYVKTKEAQFSYKGHSMNPRQDWGVLVITFAVVVVFLGISSYVFYGRISRGELFLIEEESDIKQVRIDNELMNKIVKDIDDRAISFNEARQHRSNTSDPSF